MGNLIPKNKFIILAITTALLGIFLYFIGVFVVLGQKREIENSYLNTESEITKEEKIRVIKSILETNNEPIQILQDYFVQKNDEVKFIEQIEKVAKISGVNFDIISIDIKTKQTDSFKEDINIKIKLEGSWQNLMNFVNRLEKMSLGVLIENLSLDTNASNGWSGFIEIIVFREK